MEFRQFRDLMQKHMEKMFKTASHLFVVDSDKHEIWETYLDSFPEGTNQIYRERREFDCNCCKQFMRAFGNVVSIQNNQIVSIWDFQTNDEMFQPVINALSSYVKSKPVRDVFITNEKMFGTKSNRELLDGNIVQTWEHFYVQLPKKFITISSNTIPTLIGKYRDVRNVFKRSLEEISRDSIEVVLDLISQNSLYKGGEWKAALNAFLKLHNEYNKLPDSEKENYCWSKSIEVGGAISKIKNHSIGVLLVNITNGIELNEAVRKYEFIVAPVNYKRPKAIFTKKMIEQAQKLITDLNLMDSLGRRHAMIEDITINNILFANKDAQRKMVGGNNVFDELQKETLNTKKSKFDKVQEIPIEQFITDILPRTTNMEVFLENKNESNFVSLIAPVVKDSPSMFKWNNGFSWAYNGNITDSMMKERVKAAGGNVSGVLRFSIQWNEDGDNRNDYDAHCKEPSGNHIWFNNKGFRHTSTGMLDVDIIHPKSNQVAVENITWTDISKMPEGTYQFYVNNYNHRGGRNGFRAEIEYNGEIYSFNYNKDLGHGRNVMVAKIKFSRTNGIQFLQSLPSSVSSRTIWGLQTNEFHPVSVCMFSPNYWDLQTGIGHKHYFFMLKDCINETRPNGFFNEFLREDLMQHKRVFEALGSKMRVADSDNQLSGLGFSSTKRNSLICKLEGHMTRTVKLVF